MLSEISRNLEKLAICETKRQAPHNNSTPTYMYLCGHSNIQIKTYHIFISLHQTKM